MRRQALLIAVCLFPGAALRAQDEAGPKPAGEHAGHEMKPAAAGAEIEAEWEKVEGHWAMVQTLSGPEKAEHLEMHRSMLGDLMSRLDAHAEGLAEAKEGRGPTVGDRMEKADAAPVPPEREAPLEDEAMAATEEGKTGERIDEERAAKAEAGAGAAAGGAKADIAEIQSHWALVQGIDDPAQLETHLQMHMGMLEDHVKTWKRSADEDMPQAAPETPPGGSHEGMQHGAADEG